MSEKKTEDTFEGLEDEKPAKPKSGLKGWLPIAGIIGAVMIGEAVMLLVAMKWVFGGPAAAVAAVAEAGGDGEATPSGDTSAEEGSAESTEGETPPADESLRGMEVEVATVRAPNEKGGRVYIYEIKVAVMVPTMSVNVVRSRLKARESTVRDRLIQIVRRADPEFLEEETLGTLRRQIRYELGKILGDDSLIEEVLIASFQKFRTDI